MEITIKLHGVLRIGRFNQARQTFPADSKVKVVVDSLKLSADLLGIVLINGIHADVEHVLKNGDTLSLLPLLDGG